MSNYIVLKRRKPDIYKTMEEGTAEATSTKGGQYNG